jgi:acyl carrier protein
VGGESHPLESRRLNEQEFLHRLSDRLAWPDLGPDTQLSGDERWDSLAQVDVVMFVQDELGHTLPANELQNVAQARDLVGLVRDRLA